MQPAVFLDRDNTIIHNDGDLGDPGQVQLIQGAASAIASLCGLGYRVIVVTNQGGVARGKYKEADVDGVHDRLAALVKAGANGARIDAFYFCPYHPKGNLKQYRKDHPDRKPHPGMLLRAAEDHKLDLSQSWLVGDQLRDIQAGKAAGVRTVLVGELAQAGEPDALEPAADPDFLASNLTEAVRVIAQQRKPEAVEQIERAEMGGKRWDAAAVARIQKQSPKPNPKPESDSDAESRVPRAEDFRPWNAPPAREDKPAALPRRRFRRDAESEPQSPGTGEVDPAQPAVGADAAPQERASSEPAPLPEPEPPPEPVEPGDRTLRQILQELRNQRSGLGEFNASMLGAVALQLIALICLAGALFMPPAGDTDMLLRWLGAGLIVQLMTIALLLFSRSR